MSSQDPFGARASLGPGLPDVYRLDVLGGRTSVFVASGRVAVQHREPSPSVILGAGQGVDVVPGRPLDVKTWGAERTAGLLARFGR